MGGIRRGEFGDLSALICGRGLFLEIPSASFGKEHQAGNMLVVTSLVLSIPPRRGTALLQPTAWQGNQHAPCGPWVPLKIAAAALVPAFHLPRRSSGVSIVSFCEGANPAFETVCMVHKNNALEYATYHGCARGARVEPT